jgi:biofilm PGA synthesis lipoprotein PgaB
VRGDLEKSRALMQRHLGKSPRALAWPFGRYNEAGNEVAKALGFRFALTLDPEPAWISKPMSIGRLLPTERTRLQYLVRELQYEDPLPRARRLVALDPAALWSGDEVDFNERLGHAIERLRTLGATAIVLEAGVMAGDRLVETWFPNSQLPVRADILSRIAWQCQSRAGVKTYVRLPIMAATHTLQDSRRVQALFRDLGIYVPASGMFVDDVPGLARLATADPSNGFPWEVRNARAALDGRTPDDDEAQTLKAFREIEFWRPGLEMIVVGGECPAGGPSGIADLTLIPHTPGLWATPRMASKLRKMGWFDAENFRRGGLWFLSRAPLSAARLEGAARAFQSQGGTAFGWAVDDPVGDRPKASEAGKAVSASTFPIKF